MLNFSLISCQRAVTVSDTDSDSVRTEVNSQTDFVTRSYRMDGIN